MAGTAGAIANSADTPLFNTTVYGNHAPGAVFPSGIGGAVASDNGPLTLSGSTFTNNSAANIGGGVVHFGGTLQLDNSIIAGNVVTGGAQIVYLGDTILLAGLTAGDVTRLGKS